MPTAKNEKDTTKRGASAPEKKSESNSKSAGNSKKESGKKNSK